MEPTVPVATGLHIERCYLTAVPQSALLVMRLCAIFERHNRGLMIHFPRTLPLLCFLMLSFFVLCPMCSVAQDAAPVQQPQVEMASAESLTIGELGTSRLGPGDLVEIKVYGVPDLSEEVRIDDKGGIPFPLIGHTSIGGMTPREAQATIEAKLREGNFLNKPQVTVTAKEPVTQSVAVLGEVQKPGIYSVVGVRHLFDLLSMAGGMTSRAGKDVVITHREQPREPLQVSINYDASKSFASNIEIYPGDTVVVSRSGVVYVVGDVSKPSGFAMENNEPLTVLKALALAGGPLNTAALGKATILRKQPGGDVKEIPIPLKPILAAKAQDIPLRPEDIVFIPSSAAKRAGRKTVDAILQISTGLAIAHPY